MAEETNATAVESPADVVIEKEATAATVVVEKEVPPPEQPEAEEEKVENEKAVVEKEAKIGGCASFKEESNKVEDLVDPEKKALDELKVLIQEALDSHTFTPPPPPEEEEVEKKECPQAETADAPAPPPEAAKEEAAVVEKTEAKFDAVPSKEDIKETIVHEVTASAPPPPSDSEAIAVPTEEETAPALPPEQISIWGVPLFADERTEVILLKFLRARDFEVKEAFAMLKSVVAWRKAFKLDELLEEEDSIVEGLENVVYLHGVDRDDHPISYNAFGEFQDKELYSKAFADSEKRVKFLNWYIQFLEKSIRKLEFTPEGVSTIVQIIDLRNLPGLILFKKELRQSIKQALQLLQDNYPEFVAKQIFVNVPWWYVTYNRLITPFLTQRTKSKFVFAGATRTAETLLKYIAPEQLPVQYGGLGKKGDHEFTSADPVTEEILKPTAKHTIEFPKSEAGATVVWEVRVIGWDVSYGVEFVPSAEGSYTWIVQKPRKISPQTQSQNEEQVIAFSFKVTEAGKVVLTFDNQTSKKKKLLYRFKTKSS